ncbi:MBOAT family protein [bacterium]|nr:MBOAT family protein [bacterium]
MVFSSVIFLLYFLPIVLAVNYLLPARFRNYWLLFSSLFFYAWGAPDFVMLLMGSVVANFFAVKAMHQSHKFNKIWLVLSLTINVGLLIYFKYFNFFVDNINILLAQIGVQPMGYTKVLLPIGISFFTFQSLTYTIDVYRKVHEPLRKLSDYALYIMLFPQMIAGPIVRFSSIAGELVSRHTSHQQFKQGIHRFVIGLSKKVLLANTLAEFSTETLLQNGAELNATTAWLGILAYTFQIYFDFSGYSDMAIGLGNMLGFTFPENFNNPYASKSITEFWRRWHITLSTWMRDYLYIPLGGNRVGSKGRLYFNLAFVFIISGLWHGASWNFIIWGAYHGFFLIIERLFLGKILKNIPAVFSVSYAFLAALVGWVFFSIESFGEAVNYISIMFSGSFGFSELLLDRKYIFTLIISAVFAFWLYLPHGANLQNWFFGAKYRLYPSLAMNVVSVVLLLISFMHLVASGFNPFIYFRF